MPEQFDSKYFRGQGPLFAAPRDTAGAPAGLIFIGDLGEATLTANIERAELRENVSGINALASSFQRSVQYELSMTMRSIKRAHLARALQASVVDKPALTVSNERHKAYRDKFIALKHNKISAVTVTNTAGTTTYVANTDYKVWADQGLIEILTGAITEGQEVDVDYSYAAQYHVQAAPSNLELYMLFAGKNSANNDKQTRCEIYKAVLNPGVLSLISDEHAEMQITGQVLLDTLRAQGDQYYSWKIED
jgi:hypothetical protein